MQDQHHAPGKSLEPNPEPVVTDRQWEEATRQAKSDFHNARVDDDTFVIDDAGGIKEVLRFDTSGDSFSLERVQDVESVLEWCRGRYNEGLVNRHCEFRQVASFPTNVVEIYAKANLGPKAQWDDMLKRENEGLFKRMLNDPDLTYFRTLGGRV